MQTTLELHYKGVYYLRKLFDDPYNIQEVSVCLSMHLYTLCVRLCVCVCLYPFTLHSFKQIGMKVDLVTP